MQINTHATNREQHAHDYINRKLNCKLRCHGRKVALLFFVDLPPILLFVLYELCYEYIMKFIFVTFPCRRSGYGRACMRGICLPVEFCARVRVGRMSSPS